MQTSSITIGGSEPMMPAEALASIDIAWIFSVIFLRSRSTLRGCRALPERVAARLLLDRDHDAEEVRFRHRHPLVEPRAGLAERHADGLGLDDGAELALQRLRRVGGDHLDRSEQRQAGLDAAHDDVDGVGQRLRETPFAALLEKVQEPARQAEARRRKPTRPRPPGP